MSGRVIPTSTPETAPEAEPVGFYQRAVVHPQRPAVIDPDGSTLTYGELLVRINRCSRALRSLGLTAGDVVAVAAHNDHEYLELVLATGQVGMRFVPVNWRLSAAEMTYIIQDSGAKVVIASAEQARVLPSESLPSYRYVSSGSVVGWTPYAELGRAESAADPPGRQAGSIMGYTSGTTGHPKGVRSLPVNVEPEIVIARTLAYLVAGYGVTSDNGTHLVCSPLYHAAPGNHALAFLHAGHTIVIQSRFDAENVLRAIEEHRINTVHLVPTHFHRLLRLPQDVRDRYDISSLQAVIHAGAPCPVAIKQQMIEWLGPIVWEYLGATEGLVSRVSASEWLARPGTVGRPIAGITVQILDEDGQERPRGEEGTIYFGVAGRDPTFEYNGDPAKTTANRLGDLATVGDIGYLDADDYLFLLDRRTDLIISGGVNIYPAEIEQVLITHPAVDDVAVIGRPDPEWGQSVLAVVKPVPGIATGADLVEELLRHCAERLAAFKRPRQIEFRVDFPRTETGKLERRKLRDAYARPENTDAPNERPPG